MLLVDNSVLKMYLLQSQLSLKIKSVTFIVIIYLYLPGKAMFWRYISASHADMRMSD
jgi:hypothetical protein